MPPRGIGIIITPAAVDSRAQLLHGEPEGVAQDQLLEAHAGAEAQRARAQSSDRASSQLEHAHAALVHTQFGVDRPLAQPERARRAGRDSLDLGQHGGAGSRDGVTYSVSSKYGPSSGSGLSKIASTSSRPERSRPSTATSAPGR